MSAKKLTFALLMTLSITAASLSANETTKISSQSDFQLIRNTLRAGGNFELADNIILTGEFTPIGTLSTPFIGSFNGNGFTVSGLNVNRTDSANGWAVGLFGVIGQTGSVRNVRVEGGVTGYHAAGVLAGISSGTVQWCYSGGSVKTVRTRESNSGGLVGINGGTILQSYSDADVGGVNTQNAGGLVGFLTNTAAGVIYNSFAVGSVEGVRSAGGLVGYVFSGTVRNCYAAAKVDASASSASPGGLIGFDFGNTNSWNSQGRNPGSGGSYVMNVKVENSYWDTKTSTQTTSAGGEGLSTEEMKDIGSILEWDTLGIWVIVDGEYPKLRTAVTAVDYLAGRGGKLMVGGEVGRLSNFTAAITGIARGPLVAAVPDSGYRFVGWSDNSRTITRAHNGVDGDYKITKITVTANFEAIGSEIIEIANISDLRKIGVDNDYPLNGNYVLTGSISNDGVDFTPIGTSGDPFTGTFIGKSDETLILNLKIAGNESQSDNVGLFGYTKGAVIRGVSLQVDVFGARYIGTLAGTSENTFIDSSAATGSVLSSGGDGAGGLVGNSLSSVIIRSFSSASSKGADRGAGGLVGLADNSFIAYSYTAFNVEAEAYAGGLLGQNVNGVVQFCYSSGNVEGGGERIGGLIGEITGNGIVYQSYSAGQAVSANREIFGLTGAAREGAVSASYFIAPISQADGFGLTSLDMRDRSKFTGWDFENVWNISDGSYPFLREIKPHDDDLPGINKFSIKQVSSITRAKPFALVNGRTLIINTNPSTELRVSLIDMRGRTIARYNTKGSARISLSKVPSGRYVVEARENGRRIEASRIVVR
ncbi:MAG: T9SS type A sorting domain-containing protein [Chitinispirillia bacterium]|nr:T9SS type A sorting domain-containing protein [Chitinispirillia bacterium]